MNTIRRSGSIFFTPLPISTTTFGFSTMVLRRLKSNLDPSLSSLSLGVLVPQPIFLIQAWGRSKWLNYCHKPNLHCRQMTSTNKLKTSFRLQASLRVSMVTFFAANYPVSSNRKIFCFHSPLIVALLLLLWYRSRFWCQKYGIVPIVGL